MAVFLERRMLLAIKLEAVEGTYGEPAGSDANLLVYDVKFDADIASFSRKPMISDLSGYSAIMGTRKAKVSFKVELKGSGVAGTAPALGKLLKVAGGMGETVVAATSVTYAPVSVGFSSASIALYTVPESGNQIVAKIRGARGNVKWTPKAGEPVMLEFELEGVYQGVADAAGLTASGLETTKPQPFLNTSFSLQGTSLKVSNFGIDMGIKTALREDIAQAEGFFSSIIVDREPTFSCDPEKELVATHDFYGKLVAGTEGAISCVIGATAGNIVTITAPKAQYVTVKEASRNGIAIYQVDGKLNRSAGNDEISIAFT